MDDRRIPDSVDSVGGIAGTSKKASTASNGPRLAGNRRPRIVIADDDPIALDQIAGLLRNRFEVVAQVCNGHQLVEAVRRFSPAAVVADVTMPEVNGIEAARQITSAFPGVKVVMLSVHNDPTFVEAAFEAGASGYVFKLGASKQLIPAIEDVLAGRSYRPPGFE